MGDPSMASSYAYLNANPDVRSRVEQLEQSAGGGIAPRGGVDCLRSQLTPVSISPDGMLDPASRAHSG